MVKLWLWLPAKNIIIKFKTKQKLHNLLNWLTVSENRIVKPLTQFTGFASVYNWEICGKFCSNRIGRR